jgi:hypothetical protein
LFQFVVVSKVASFSGPNRWQSEGATSGLWPGWGRTVLPIFAIVSRVRKLVWGRALSWRRSTSFMSRLDRTLRMRYRGLFKVSLYRSLCAPKSRQGILQHCYTESYSPVAKLRWKWRRHCGIITPYCKRYVNHPCNFYWYCSCISWEKIWMRYFCTAPRNWRNWWILLINWLTQYPGN